MTRCIALAVSVLLLTGSAFGQVALTVNGVTDRSTYTDTATFTVVSNAGYTYSAMLNGKPVAVGVAHTIPRMDYYDLDVSRTNTSTLETTNRLVRFIVLSSNRGSPETGLIEWTPYPPINSTAAEFAGAHLEIVAPQDYPQGLPIPIAARAVDNADNERRGNGWVSAPGFETNAFRLLRGHGHGFLPAATTAGPLSYNAQISAMQSNKVINIDTSTTWTAVSGALNGTTIWGTNARISVNGHIFVPPGSLLRVLEGAIVRLLPGVNITNGGKISIEGTTDRPVVFTATNRVAPEVRAGAWGGFYMRTDWPNAELVANGAIMTGAGAATGVSFSPGSSHKSDQALLFAHQAKVSMTNCYLVNNAGQIANGYFSDITYDHCLLQRAITSGESVGGTIIINHTAVIEFPSVDGVYNATIADADYDAIYFTEGTHILMNSLFGFCKDDAIDSGSGGAGTVLVTNCWVESALHEANAWSGGGRQTWTYDSVLMNSGQGLECGWSTGTNSPLVYANRMLSIGNSVGVRYGDNYTGTSGLGLKSGHVTVSNSFVLNNYRDVLGRAWDDTWSWRTNDMSIFNNQLTTPYTYHPNNGVWNPTADAAFLAPFMHTPPQAAVGIGFAVWTNQLGLAEITNGIPVRLSTFTTNTVTVRYTAENASGPLAAGTLTFVPGEMVKPVVVPGFDISAQTFVRVFLSAPTGGEITGESDVYLSRQTPPVTLVANGASWRYNCANVDLGTAWRAIDFDDSGWSSGVAQLGAGDGDEATPIPARNASNFAFTTVYFRGRFLATNVASLNSLTMNLLRDDGGVVYINGAEVYRSPVLPPPPTAITFNTFANFGISSAPGDNTVDTATLPAASVVEGTNVVAVEIHQYNASSSDVSFQLSLVGTYSSTASAPQRIWFNTGGGTLNLSWIEGAYNLEEAPTVTGPWSTVVSPSPISIPMTNQQRFYRLNRP